MVVRKKVMMDNFSEIDLASEAEPCLADWKL